MAEKLKRYKSILNESTKKMTESYTKGDLSKLGNREKFMLGELLVLLGKNRLSRNANNYGGVITSFDFNRKSGNVFLIDEDYNAFMKNGNSLDIFINLPFSGEEGFPDEFNGRNVSEFEEDDIDFLKSFGKFDNKGNFKSN